MTKRARWKRIIALSAAVLTTCVFLAALVVWCYDPFSARLAELRAAGEQISLEDFAEIPVPREQNADTYLTTASPGANRLIDLFIEGSETGDAILFKTLVDYNDADLDAIKRAFDAETNVLLQLEKAARAPSAYHQLTWKPPTQDLDISDSLLYQQYRAAANVLAVQARYSARAGCGDEGLMWCICQLRLSRHLRRPTTRFAWLIGMATRNQIFDVANEILRHTAISQTMLDQFEAELAAEDDEAQYKRMLEVERAGYVTFYQNEIDQNLVRRPWLRLWGNATIDRWTDEILRVDRSYGDYRTSGKPESAWIAMDNLEDGLQRSREAFETCRARKRCLQVLIAMKKVSPELNEDLSLAALELPASARIDPFSGEVLKVKPTTRGPVIYSIGSNLVDDGGSVTVHDGNQDVGFGPIVTRLDLYFKQVTDAMNALREHFREGARIKYWSRLLQQTPQSPDVQPPQED